MENKEHHFALFRNTKTQISPIKNQNQGFGSDSDNLKTNFLKLSKFKKNIKYPIRISCVDFVNIRNEIFVRAP